MLLPAALISAVGYCLYEALITGSLIASLSGIPASLVQAVASSIVYVAIGVAMDKYDVKKKMLGD
jgi:phosphate/sulfate permease